MLRDEGRRRTLCSTKQTHTANCRTHSLPIASNPRKGREEKGRELATGSGRVSVRGAMKYVLVTGGVVSGLGKGVTASSIGVVLKSCGLRVTSIKIGIHLLELE